MTILVADDDPIVLESCRRILEAEGHRVVLARSAAEALQTVAAENPELALVDVVMPQYTGTYTIIQIRKRWPRLPVLLMSGYLTPEVVVRGLDAGANQVLAKPFTPEELVEAIQRTLAAKAGTGCDQGNCGTTDKRSD